MSNPYATALDGLDIPDPVAAFFGFCREREAVRTRRAAGLPAPWSEDPIFQQGRFLNVFREDDRTTKAIFEFIAPIATPTGGSGGDSDGNLENLLHALFFARWCNSQTTLDGLDVQLLKERMGDEGGDLRDRLAAMATPPWCNVTAYPVEPITWDGTRYSRLDAAAVLFADPALQRWLTAAVRGAKGSVVAATRAIASRFAMQNDFPVFMAIMDVAWFRPDVIDPSSHVPTGIGAVAFLDRLQRHLGLSTHEATIAAVIALQPEHWPEARRALQPIDVEYLSCECRKYYSYVNGTKRFEGKNIFLPGRSPSLEFDVAPPAAEEISAEASEETAEMKKNLLCVIAGGPGSGKSTLCAALQAAGYRVAAETAELLLSAAVADGGSAEEMRIDPVAWQMELLQRDYTLFDGLLRKGAEEGKEGGGDGSGVMFSDTSFIEDLAYARRAGIEVGPNVRAWLKGPGRYALVFFLAPLEAYESTEVRLESARLAAELSAEIRGCYETEYGYELCVVPAVSTAERLQIVLTSVAGL